MPAPIKDAASFQKIFFLRCTMVCFANFSLIFTTCNCTKFSKMYLFLLIFFGAATIQERPLLVRVRYLMHFTKAERKFLCYSLMMIGLKRVKFLQYTVSTPALTVVNNQFFGGTLKLWHKSAYIKNHFIVGVYYPRMVNAGTRTVVKRSLFQPWPNSGWI